MGLSFHPMNEFHVSNEGERIISMVCLRNDKKFKMKPSRSMLYGNFLMLEGIWCPVNQANEPDLTLNLMLGSTSFEILIVPLDTILIHAETVFVSQRAG